MSATITRSNSASTDVEQRTLPTDHLTLVLAQLIDLRQQVKQAHWNVRGPSFIGLHKMFDKMAHELDESIDVTAERQRALGSPVHGSLREADSTSTLKDYPEELTHAAEVLHHLLENYRQIVAELIEASAQLTEAHDPGTADLYADLIRQLDQHAYLMNSHFE